VLLPALLLGPVLSGAALLLHAHGEEGEHLHLVSAEGRVEHDSHGTHAELQHVAEHRRAELDHGDHGSDSPRIPEEPRHEGSHLLIVFPGTLQLVSVGSATLLRSAQPVAFVLAPAPLIESTRRAPAFVGVGPPGRSWPGKERSGVAALVATSRAILI